MRNPERNREYPVPEGYTFFWDAQYKDQGEAMQAIAKYFPLAFLALVVILVGLFGNSVNRLSFFVSCPCL